MALIVKDPKELKIPQFVKIMIYGQSGMGKTTVALSAPKPLLLDFDNGVNRVNLSHLQGVGTLQVENWADIQDLLLRQQEEIKEFKTIVVDTIGKMMDYIIIHCCGSRQPSIKDWGRINQEFTWFTRSLSALGKHIVFVAHRDTRKEGDDTVFVPALREKTYNSIVTELDLLGYMEMKSERGYQSRTITFDPTSRNDGKNTCNLPSVMQVPVIVNANGQAIAPNDFIQEKVIKPYLSIQTAKSFDKKKYDELMKQIKSDIESVVDAETAEAVGKKIKEYKHIGTSKEKAAQLFKAKLGELSLAYDKETETYVNVDPAA